ncbi:MAG TPA: amino acid adenylation domain-containing protein [Candidatus Angelobacter sp.]
MSEIQKAVGRGELFDTIVVFENYPLDRAALKEPLEGVRITGMEGHEETHYPLSLTVVDGKEDVRLELDLDGARVKEAGQDVGRWLVRLLEVIAEGEDVPLQQLEILEEEERQRLLQENQNRRAAAARNGNGDRRFLPASAASASNYRAPRTAKEQALCQIFSEVLAVTRVGLGDNFFYLGGDSILSIQVVSRARRAGLEINPREIFEQQTVEGLAAVARERVEEPRQSSAKKGPELVELSAEERARLEGVYGELEEVLPLSPLQEGLLFHSLYDQSAADTYTVQLSLELVGVIDAARMKLAFAAVLHRHANLRVSIYHQGAGRALQVVPGKMELPWREIDLSALDAAAQQVRCQELQAADRAERFVLAAGLLLQMTWLQLGPERQRLMFTNHHILMDGWSMPLFFSELLALYRSGGDASGVPPVHPYADYLRWLAQQDSKAGLQVWREYLAGVEEGTRLVQGAEGGQMQRASEHRELELSRELTLSVQAMARERGWTVNTVVQGLWAVLLGRLTGTDDVVFGVTVSGRPAELAGVEQMIGLFINTLPLRVRMRGGEPLVKMLNRIQERQLRLLAVQHVGLSEIQKEVGRGELFDTILVFQNYPLDRAALNGLPPDVQLADAQGWETTHYPLSLTVFPEKKLQLRLDFDPARISAAEAQSVAARYERLLEAAVATPGAPLHRFEILTAEERHTLLVEFNPRPKPLPTRTITSLFEEQVKRTPSTIAIVFGGETLTYAELDRQANQLGHYLRERGIGLEMPVAVCLERSLEMVVALLGILKAGGAYVPLDPTYPMERLDFMLQDSAAPVLLTKSAMRDRLPASWVQCVEMDASWDEIRHQPDENLHIEVQGRNAAYAIYTSGSTGQPKGVLVPHEAVVRLVCEPNYVKLNAACRILQLASLSFDAATFEIWGALLNGSSLVVMQPGLASAEEIAEVITEQGITTLWLTAGLFHELADSSLSTFTNLLHLLAGGDVLSGTKVEQVREAAPQCRVINGYGPTENTTFTACYPVPENADVRGGVPIGFPINHTRVYVLDGNLELVPVGVKGELFAAGTGLARGYVNRPDLTAEHFVPDPFAAPGTRMYRTGDLVRWRTDGALEFLGRADHQVKVRGHRIELGEIEAALIRHSSVRQCAVIAREDHPGDKRLVAYIVSAAEHAADSDTLREYLSKTLPVYMVPAAFVTLNVLPLTPNGKLDHRALPPPERQEQNVRLARTQHEQILCGIFAEVLSLEQVGVDGNFFYLGGDSILAIQLVSRARRAGLDITLRDVFQQPTVEALASGARIADEAPESTISSSELALSLSSEQRAPVEATYPGLADILPLSPLQEGLLFHALYDQSAPDIYTVQLSVELEGVMDASRMKLAFEAVLHRHPNLRISIYYEGAGRALQVVPGKTDLPWREVDLSALDAEAQQVRCDELQAAEREERFVLASGPLLRMTWVRLGPQRQRLVFTVHHILMDGWSMPLFFGELLALYASGGDTGGLPLVRPYADYLRWLAQQDSKAGLEVWKEYLADVDEGTRVAAAKAAELQRASEHRERELSSELTAQVQTLARERGLTVNTVVQGLWAVLMGRLTGRDDVVFGVTVSGRPAELAGVEQMIGLFINTLPLRVRMRAEEPLGEMLSRIQESQSRLVAVQHVGLSEIQEAVGCGNLFDAIVVFENYPLDSRTLSNLLPDVQVKPLEGWDGVHYPLGLVLTLEERLHLRVDYDPQRFAPELAETIVPRLVRLLEQALANPALPVYRLTVLNAEERSQLLEEFNATARAIPQASLAQLFEAQAAQTPNAIALLLDDRSLSYSDLNHQANRLAHFLIAHGVGPENLIGICLERSFEMVTSLLAIVKAGAAYLPLDPDYPQARLEYMAADAAPPIVLTSRHLRSRLPQNGNVLELDSPHVHSALAGFPTHNPGNGERITPLLPQHPAYVIYTSGSTGQPKGVVVEHKGLAALAACVGEKLGVNQSSRFLQFASLSFDTSLWEMLTALSSGAASVLLREDQRSGASLREVLVRQQVTHALIPPAVLPTLGGEEDLPLPVLIVGGEACPGELVGRWSKGRRMINSFGPTETTVAATMSGLLSGSETPPIGVPMWNTRVYVLDGHLEPVPQGIAGELYIAGLGLARGYLNRMEVTAERFVADPYGIGPGTRMYRTGDLVRWSKDGTLEFLGRVDQQVKIRGFRVELGEVETALLAQEGIKQAVVTVRQEGTGSKRLVGYVIAAEGARIDLESVRQRLRERLPEHMVPATFVLLDALPITPSGKVDLRSLPAPETPLKKYRQPRTSKEQALCRILSEILGVERIGLDDNFFQLGGDSILSIQLVGRARAMGLSLSPRDVFQQPGVEALAAITRMKDADLLSQQNVADGTGEIVATPIIRSFLEGQASISRFSQSVMLQVPAGIREADLLTALQTVIDSHDVLRMQFESGGRLHVRSQGTVSAKDCLVRVQCDSEEELRAAARDVEGRLDPEHGAMMQVAWLTNQRRLFWVIHHLAVDGVSWRILLPDLVAAWEAVVRGKEPVLERVDTSFRAWAAYLADRATTRELEAEIPKWEKILLDGRSLLPGAILDPTRDTVSSAGHLSVSLSRSATSALLTSVPAAFHARINDVLLTTLALSVAAWQRSRGIDGDGSILIDLEGHGREPGESGLDLSRTVGWFTSLFPVALNVGNIDTEEALAGKASAGSALKLVKEQLRAIPGQGLGYGLLRYLHPEAGARLADMPAAQIGFNYLGRFSVDAAADWSPVDSSDGVGGAADEQMALFHLLEVNAITTDGPQGPSLSATWDWATRHLSESDVRSLAEGWKQALEALVWHCNLPGAGGHTPSDFSTVTLTMGQIEQVEARYLGLMDILPLSPLQEGLLFHALYDQSGPDVYTVQLVIEFEGAMNAAQMKSAFAAVLHRHPNLRVSIYHEGLGRALQVVPGEIELPWREFDLSALNADAQQVRCQELQAADREERFVLAAGLLLRMTWLRLGPRRQQLVFTNHHILMDGWSVPLFFGELLALYRRGGDAGGLPPVRPYADYLRWLAQQDSAAGLEAWKEYLAGVEEGTRVVDAADAREALRASEHRERELSSELTAQVQSMARERGLTVNTVMQGLWAVLMGRLTGREDVVFGVTVSGRPAELAGVEQMIGLFINTLPLRVRMRAEEPLGEMLSRMQESQARLLAVQHVGLSEIQEAVGCGELFDTIVVFENYPLDRASLNNQLPNVQMAPVEGWDEVHYPLALIVTLEEHLHFRLDYDPRRLAPEVAETIVPRLVRLLEQVVANPYAPLYHLDVLSNEERRHLLEEFNETGRTIPQASLAELFEAQAAGNHTPALVFGERALSYAELDEFANRLARHLVHQGVRPGSLVALRLDRSPELVIAMLAIAKCGAVYVPLDLAYPYERAEFMLADSGAELLLTSESVQDAAAQFPARTLTIDELLRISDADSNFHSNHSPGQLAYVMYTSGSSGIPKGIAVPQSAVVRLVCNTDYVTLRPGDRVAQCSNTSFDAATFEIWGALLNGATLMILSSETMLSPGNLAAALKEQRVDTLFLTTALFNQIASDDPGAFAGIRDLLIGGEAVDPSWVHQVLAGNAPYCLLNVYGPTENTTFSTWERVTNVPKQATTVPIGRPVANTTCYVLNSWLEPVPLLAVGELYLGGAGLAQGYWSRRALTAERFVANPYGPPGTRIYRTGDLVRWNAERKLEFFGRTDQQVKIRGFRIEPGEIEAALREQPGIQHAAVIASEAGRGDKQLVAYVSVCNGDGPNEEHLRAGLRKKLPEFMVPAAFVFLDQLPLTPNGKLDRNALPAPDRQVQNYHPPATPEEELLCAIFAELLSVKRVSVEDDFFSLGGHSLMAMRVVGRVRSALGIEISVRDVFAARTVRELGATIVALQFAGNGGHSSVVTVSDEFEEEEI